MFLILHLKEQPWMSGYCRQWAACWVFFAFLFLLLYLMPWITRVYSSNSQQCFVNWIKVRQGLQVRNVKLSKCWVCAFFLQLSICFTLTLLCIQPATSFGTSVFAEQSPVHLFPTEESFQPSSFLLIRTQAMKPFCSLNFPQLITVSFQDKSRFQKCKQTAHKTLNSLPSLTSVSKTPLICCSDSDTCRWKSDCCKNCCSFSWRFLPLLARTTANYNLGYYKKN